MKKIALSDREFAKICLTCPYEKCESDFWGNCDRTKPYQQANKHKKGNVHINEVQYE